MTFMARKMSSSAQSMVVTFAFQLRSEFDALFGPRQLVAPSASTAHARNLVLIIGVSGGTAGGAARNAASARSWEDGCRPTLGHPAVGMGRRIANACAERNVYPVRWG